MRLSPSARKLLSSVIAELQKISDRMQSHENAVRDAYKAYEKQTAEPQLITVTVPQGVKVKKDAEDANQESVYQRRNLRWQRALTIFTAAAFVAAAYYACIAKRQWDTMNSTYHQIKTQTDQLTKQTTMLHQQLSGTEGAAITATFQDRVWPNVGENGQVSVLFRNSGKVPARISGVISLTRVQIPTGDTIPDSQTSFPIANLTVLNGSDGHEPYRIAPLFGVLPHDETLYRETKIAIKIEVSFQYDNGFGDVFTGSQCAFAFNTEMNDAPPQTPASLLGCDGVKRLDYVLKQKATK